VVVTFNEDSQRVQFNVGEYFVFQFCSMKMPSKNNQ